LKDLPNENLLRIKLSFERPNVPIAGGQTFGVRVASNLKNQYTEIGVTVGKEASPDEILQSSTDIVYVDRSISGVTDFHPDFANLKSLAVDYFQVRECSRIVNIEILVDRSSVEVFFMDGLYTMTN
jgi:sucrose-6-phosphate hydrolase SacC (GH32 family)